MNIRDIDLNLLVVFSALMKYQNVSAAAKSLSITQPSMSNALNRLRSTLNDEILVRVKGGMAPTPKALKLKGPISRMITELEYLLLEDQEFDPTELDMTFTMSSTDAIQQFILPRLLERLREVAPNISLNFISLDPEYSLHQLESGNVNFILAVNWTAPQHLKQVRLYDESFSCMLREDHPALSREWDLESYAALNHLLVAPLGGKVGVVDKLLEEKGLSRKITVTTPHFLIVPSILMSSDLIVTLPTRVAKELSNYYPLKVIPPPIAIPEYSIYTMWHPRFDYDPVYKWFREQLRLAAS